MYSHGRPFGGHGSPDFSKCSARRGRGIGLPAAIAAIRLAAVASIGWFTARARIDTAEHIAVYRSIAAGTFGAHGGGGPEVRTGSERAFESGGHGAHAAEREAQTGSGGPAARESSFEAQFQPLAGSSEEVPGPGPRAPADIPGGDPKAHPQVVRGGASEGRTERRRQRDPFRRRSAVVASSHLDISSPGMFGEEFFWSCGTYVAGSCTGGTCTAATAAVESVSSCAAFDATSAEAAASACGRRAIAHCELSLQGAFQKCLWGLLLHAMWRGQGSWQALRVRRVHVVFFDCVDVWRSELLSKFVYYLHMAFSIIIGVASFASGPMFGAHLVPHRCPRRDVSALKHSNGSSRLREVHSTW